MATIVYNGTKHGDHVRCNNCGAVMLLPCGAEQCPECGFVGGLAWVNDLTQEADFDEVGEIVDKQVDEALFAYLDYCG